QQAVATEQRAADFGKALGRPASGATERPRAGHQQQRVARAQVELSPARGGPTIVIGGDAQLETRRSGAPCAEHADHVEPAVHFVTPAKSAIDRGLREEPAATPIVQSDAPRRAAPQTQRRVLGSAKGGGEVVQQDQRVPPPGAKLLSEAKRRRQTSQRVNGSI